MMNTTKIPADLDKFYVNPEEESVTWVYYNPDSSAGGQLVYHTFTYDQLFEAIVRKEPMDYIEQVAKTELVDVTDPNFTSIAQEFLADEESFNSRDEDISAKLSALIEPRYGIFQLKDDDRLRDYRFSDSEYLRNHSMYIDRENYNRVYRGRLKESETLDDIYQRFSQNHPQDFRGHSLSIGDIVSVKKNGAITTYYVDRTGFTEVPDFTLSREERKARRTLTDNLTLIADNQLASDEMDDLGDKLFDYDNAPKYSGNAPWTMGAALHAADFESLTARYNNGEDIRAELAQKIYGNMTHIEFYEFPPADGIGIVDISTEKTDTGMTFRTKGGFEITHSWETLGEALITAARQEFDRHEQLDRISDFISIASHSLYENSVIRNAHENSDKQEFVFEVEKEASSFYARLVTGEEYSKYSTADIAPLYNRFQQDKDFKANILTAVTKYLDENLTNLEQTKQKAAEMGIPFSDRSYNSDESEDFNPYAYDGSMSIENSRKVADANNLRDFMLDYSDELELATVSYNSDEFRKYFADRAAEALRSSHEQRWNEIKGNSEYLKSVCDLVSASLYNDILSAIQQRSIKYPVVYVNGSHNRNFSPEEVGFKLNYPYSVEEFNAALKEANERWNNDDKYEDKLHSVSVSVYASRTESSTYNVELYASYHSIGEIIDMKQSIASANIFGKLKAAISEIENKTNADSANELYEEEDNSDEMSM